MRNSIEITTVKSDAEIQGILDLQQKNLRKNVSAETISSQGFVTVHHNFPLLRRMNDAEPSVIAKDGETVVAYCLAMLPTFRDDVPELISLFETIDKIAYKGAYLKDFSYFVMGQVCVGEAYRGMKLFDAMYRKLRESLSNRYELCVTDISGINTRSLAAHARVGFEIVHEFYDETLNEFWEVVLWDWRA